MSSIYKKQHKLAVHEFDFNNKLKVNSLFNYIQHIKEITLSFLAEAKFGNKIEIYIEKAPEKENISIFEAQNASTNKTIFKAIIEWKD